MLTIKCADRSCPMTLLLVTSQPGFRSDQLEKAGWIATPDDEDLITVTFTEDVTGLLITEARLLVLAFVPEYIRYKSGEFFHGTIDKVTYR